MLSTKPMPADDRRLSPANPRDSALGFSLIEMLVSIAIIVLLMSAVFPFLFQAQKRFQGNVVISEANQSARAGLEVMAQEIGQAGYNPQFTSNMTSSTSITPNGCPQYINVTIPAGFTGLHPGDWVSVDTGPNQELLEVFSTNEAVTTPVCAPSPPCVCGSPPSGNWIQAKFQYPHTTTPYAVSSYKMPYGGGLLYASDGSLSNAQRLEFFGDINQNGEIDYVVYSLSPMVPATTVAVNGTTYTLYNLSRSITKVKYPSLPTTTAFLQSNDASSPMVEKVLFNTTSNTGPTGLPIFAYPNSVTVGVIPNQITVVGTIVITLCVAVNPQAMETSRVTWYTMATQIRPLNLNSVLYVNNSFGGLYLPPTPKSLPMQ